MADADHWKRECELAEAEVERLRAELHTAWTSNGQWLRQSRENKVEIERLREALNTIANDHGHGTWLSPTAKAALNGVLDKDRYDNPTAGKQARHD